MILFTYQFLGLVATALIIGASAPTCWRHIKHRTCSLKTWQLVLLVFASILWIMYGFRDSAPAIVILATLSLVVTTLLLVIKQQIKTPS